jgi:hypothetical protein
LESLPPSRLRPQRKSHYPRNLGTNQEGVEPPLIKLNEGG